MKRNRLLRPAERAVLAMTALFMPCWFIAFAQDAKKDFEQINKKYLEQKRLSMKINYKVFQNRESIAPIQNEQGEIKKDGDMRYHKTGMMETIINPAYNLMVDHEDSTIAIMGVYTEGIPEGNTMLYADPAKIIDRCEKIQFKETGKEQAEYILTFPPDKSEFTMMTLAYDTRTSFVSKITLYYAEPQNFSGDENAPKEKPRIEITYTDIKTNPDFSKDTFTYDRFLKKNGQAFQCKDQYKNYHIIDQTSTGYKG